ncbi:zinc finger translocation-associated protein isoform 2-T2 [Leptodactylus fuscus]|uniref:zinc finger translocation-associated protein isoform X2 n=1 Tax=Leptodactylus fuscus TaxID=238119 RepID=UPI003F4EA4B2
MHRAKFKEEEPEVAMGPKMGPASESPSKSGSLELDSPMLGIKEEAAGENMKIRTGPKKKRRRLPPVAKGTWRPVLGPERPLPSPLDKIHLEQYMNESLQQWFRLEFLMDYDYQGNNVHCMMCTADLPSLSLNDIKNHILDNHPNSLQFSATQKSVILDAWINRRETPEMGAMIPDLELEEDMTPEMEEDMDDDETEDKFPKIDQATKLRLEKRMMKMKSFGDFIEKDMEENISDCSAQLIEDDRIESSDLELLEEDESTGDVQLIEKKKWDTKEVQLLAEEWKARKKYMQAPDGKTRKWQHLEEQQKVRKELEAREGQSMEKENGKTKEDQKRRDRQLMEEQEKAREAAPLQEEQVKAGEAQMLDEGKSKANEAQLLEQEKRKTKDLQLSEEEGKAKEAKLLLEEMRKAREAQLLEEQKLAAMEAHLLEEEKKVREALLIVEKKRQAKEAQVIDEENRTSKETLVLEKEKSKTREALLLEEQKVKESQRPEQEKRKELEGKLKGLSGEAQNLDPEIVVKIEDHQYAELPNSELIKTPTQTNHVEEEKPPIPQNTVEGGKTQASEAGQQVIKVQPAQQTPAVLGIGLPMLKMETPTPIIITRVSVIPEHTIIQPPKPKPSTSASDISKTWRVIAPKVCPSDIQNQKPLTGSPDSALSPTGVDPAVWEVSMWRGNNATTIQNNAYQIRWRSDYLMDYNGLRGSVVCMYCSSSLTVLKESSIKRHIVQKHPHTANFSADEKATIMLDWENKLSEIKTLGLKPSTEAVVIGDQILNIVKAPDCDPVEPEEEEECTWSGVVPEGKGASWEFAFGRLQAKVKDPRRYQHDRWKLEFLMDYTPAKDGLICMVCGATLMNPKISTVKMHIQQKHPDTTYLSDQEKAVVMEEWEQKMASGKKASGQQHGDDEICIEINEDSTTTETNGSSVAASSPRPEVILPTFPKTPKSTPSLPPPCNSAKRNYQVRWRTEFMMDYDCRRQGLICMVCGGTLATLKVSTIKRHIVQVHPYSVDFTAEERQRILEAYSEMALHYIHSEECFKMQPQEEVKGRKRKSAAIEES